MPQLSDLNAEQQKQFADYNLWAEAVGKPAKTLDEYIAFAAWFIPPPVVQAAPKKFTPEDFDGLLQSDAEFKAYFDSTYTRKEA
jgi:hypothetical protein